MSDFSLNTNFQVGDEIKIVFDIQNNAPLGSDKTVYIVDLQEMQDIESNPNGELPRWSNVNENIGTCNNWSGKINTQNIINQTGHTDSAAQLVTDVVRVVSGVTYDDWYLPSLGQLGRVYHLMDVLDPIILSNGGKKLRKTQTHYQQKGYWMSTESQNPTNPNPVFSMSFNPNSGGGGGFGRPKSYRFRTRAFREQVVDPTVSVSVGDIFGGGIVYKVVEAESEYPAPKTDLDINFGAQGTNIFSQNNLPNAYTNFIEHTITELDRQSPEIKFDFSNSNTQEYAWVTNVRIFKKENELITEIQAGSKTTLAWSDNSKRWVSRYSYIPEYMTTFKTGIATFTNGDLFIHDDTVNKNYFYGGYYPTKVTYIENVSPSQPKVYMNHAVEGNTKPNYTTLQTEESWIMNSDLVREDYIRREGTYYSEMFGDVNDPNVSDNATYGDKLRRGTKLRGQYIKVGMTFTDKDLEVKHSNIGYITSKGHTT